MVNKKTKQKQAKGALQVIEITVHHGKVNTAGAYPGGRTPGGPSESLILAPSELKNVALTPPLNMTRCETRHCIRNIYSDLHVLILMHTPETITNLRRP